MTFQELHNNLKARCKKAAAEGRPFEDLFSAFQSEMIRQGIALQKTKRKKSIFIPIWKMERLRQNRFSASTGNIILKGYEQSSKRRKMASAFQSKRKAI